MPKRRGTWDSRIYRRVKSGDSGSIEGTGKEAELKMRRRRYAQKREADRRALEEMYEAERGAKPKRIYVRLSHPRSQETPMIVSGVTPSSSALTL
jgi:hypothetical protein